MLYLKKVTQNSQNSRPAETDPYMYGPSCSNTAACAATSHCSTTIALQQQEFHCNNCTMCISCTKKGKTDIFEHTQLVSLTSLDVLLFKIYSTADRSACALFLTLQRKVVLIVLVFCLQWRHFETVFKNQPIVSSKATRPSKMEI